MENDKNNDEDEKKENKKVITKPMFNFEKKTSEQLLEERRKRRLEYEATLNAANEESEKFRQNFLRKQRLKQEKLRKKEEELKNRKIIINVNEILAEKKEKERQELELNNDFDGESDGGYMTHSSEVDKK